MKMDELPAKSVAVRAIDVGYFNTKFTVGREQVGDESLIKAAMFPSFAPAVRSAEFANLGGVPKDTTVVEGNGVEYLVGRGAVSQLTGQEPRVVLDEYCRTDQYRALMYGALNEMAEHAGATETLVIELLVVGLPQSTFHSHAPFLISVFTGEHKIGPAGKPLRTVKVCEVRPMVQPQGALLRFGVKPDERGNSQVVVVDPGGGTLDWFVADAKQKPNWLKSGSYKGAMLECATAVADQIDPALRYQYDVVDLIDLALREGHQTFKIGTTEYEMADFHACVDMVVAKGIRAMVNKLGSLANIARLIVVGGGARLYREHLLRHYPKLEAAIETDEGAVYSNVHGFHIGGEILLRKKQVTPA